MNKILITGLLLITGLVFAAAWLVQPTAVGAVAFCDKLGALQGPDEIAKLISNSRPSSVLTCVVLEHRKLLRRLDSLINELSATTQQDQMVIPYRSSNDAST